jgi:predicted nucleic acid-binding protein
VIVADTGIFIGAADADDKHHSACAELVRRRRRELIVPSCVVVEVCWLLERNLGPRVEAEFLRSAGNGELAIEVLRPQDYLRAAVLVETYADLRLGMVDAAVVATAERLGITTIATVDRRDLSVVRPSHVAAFELLP